MRIGIDTYSLLSSTTGIGRYTAQLIDNLNYIKKPEDEIFYFWGYEHGVTKKMISDITAFSMNKKFDITKQNLWEQLVLPFKIKKYNLDIYHCSRNFNIPYWNWLDIPVLVTVHDIIPLLFTDDYNRTEITKLKYRLTLNNADFVIVVSKNTKNDILKYFNINEDKIKVIPNSVSKIFENYNLKDGKIEKIRSKYDLADKFLLTTGGLEPRKNLNLLIEVMKKAEKKYPKLFKNVDLAVTSPEWLEKERPINNLNNIKILGYVDEDDFPILMSEAELFLFPSLYEGFGLPPLEAMASGTPVISSNRSSLPEVVGDAAVMLDPDDQEIWFENIIQFLRSSEKCEEYIARGKQRITHFSQNKIAYKIYEAYKEIILDYN